MISQTKELLPQYVNKTSILELLNVLNKRISVPDGIGLLTGRLGLIFYGAYLNKLDSNYEVWNDQLITLFEDINEDDFEFASYSYANGLTGFCNGMLILHQNGFIDFDPNDNLVEFEETLYISAKHFIKSGNIDFLHEGGGVIHYFNQRLPNLEIEVYQNKLIELYLSELSNHKKITFNSTIGGFSEKGFDLGLAHGLCGQLLILCKSWEKGIRVEGLKKYILEGIDYLLLHKAETLVDGQFNFPAGVDLKADSKPVFYKLNGWCYGDLNQALLLYKASEIFGVEAYKIEADKIGDFVLNINTIEENGLDSNAHFCHGSSGVAQFYYALYRITKQERYKIGYENWVNKTVELLKKDLESNHFEDKAHELIDGLTGAALVLISYVLDDEREWDKIFLLQ